jgi:hypothetical protein
MDSISPPRIEPLAANAERDTEPPPRNAKKKPPPAAVKVAEAGNVAELLEVDLAAEDEQEQKHQLDERV